MILKSNPNFWFAFQQYLGFLILFISYNSSENLQSRIMSELGFGNLGFYNLACVQIAQVMGTLISTTVIGKVGIRVSHVLGALGIS
jgi:hypothetical protein